MDIDTKQRADVARPHPECLWEHCTSRCDGDWCHRGWHLKAMCPRHTRCRIVRVRLRSEREAHEIIAARVFNEQGWDDESRIDHELEQARVAVRCLRPLP